MQQLYSEYASASSHFCFLPAYFYFRRSEVGKKMPGDQKDPVLSMGYINLYLKIKLCDLQLFQNSQSIGARWIASLYHLSGIILTLQKAGFHTVNKFHPNLKVFHIVSWRIPLIRRACTALQTSMECHASFSMEGNRDNVPEQWMLKLND